MQKIRSICFLIRLLNPLVQNGSTYVHHERMMVNHACFKYRFDVGHTKLASIAVQQIALNASQRAEVLAAQLFVQPIVKEHALSNGPTQTFVNDRREVELDPTVRVEQSLGGNQKSRVSVTLTIGRHSKGTSSNHVQRESFEQSAHLLRLAAI
jgi:hypothetical protein